MSRFTVQSVPTPSWYFDADDLSSLWQNVGSSTPVLPGIDLQPVGRWQDRNGSATSFDLTMLGGLNVNRAFYRTAAFNGFPCVDFVGVGGGGDSMLLNTSFSQSLQAYTVILSCIVTDTAANHVIFSAGKNGVNPWQGVDGLLLQTLGAAVIDAEGSTDQINPMFPSKAISNVNPMIIAATVSVSAGVRSLSLWVNGGSAATDTGTGSGNAMVLNGFSFGDFYASGGVPCTAKVRHAVFYPSALSLDALNGIGQLFATKSQFTISRFA